MRIAVCIKQVPVVSAMTFDPVTRTLKRDGVRNEVSAFDVRALIKAVELRQTHGGEVVVLTMGPPQARDGVDRMSGAGRRPRRSSLRPQLRRLRHPGHRAGARPRAASRVARCDSLRSQQR